MGKDRESDHPGAEIMPDYTSFLDQWELWPTSEHLGDTVADYSLQLISELHPAHALNAYHKVQRWAALAGGLSPAEVKNSHLARALLAQAVGEPVIFKVDRPAVLGSAIFDMLAYLDAMEKEHGPMHPYDRAALGVSYLTDTVRA